MMQLATASFALLSFSLDNQDFRGFSYWPRRSNAWLVLGQRPLYAHLQVFVVVAE
jgi:hypothetical protein